MKLNTVTVIATTGLSMLFTAAFGGFDYIIQTLLLFMLIDLLTAIAVSIVFQTSPKTQTGTFRTSEFCKGIFRKFAILACIIIAVRLDGLLGTNYVRNSVCILFCVNEATSIFENIGLMGIKIPTFLENCLDVLKQRSENNEPKN